MNKIHILLLLLFVTSCGNRLSNNLDCKNKFADERIELCLPSNNWKSEKMGKYILFSNKLKDSTAINKTLISITIDDYKQDLDTETFRNAYIDRMIKSSDLGAELISKGIEKIDGKTFYDFEINSTNRDVYDYLMFYKEDGIGFVLRATIPEKNRNGIGKKEYLNFFKSLKIK